MSWHASRFRSHNEYHEPKTKHHKRPRSLGGTSERRNISELPKSRHYAWHVLFSNFTPERIAQEINRRYLDPDYEMIVRYKGVS